MGDAAKKGNAPPALGTPALSDGAPGSSRPRTGSRLPPDNSGGLAPSPRGGAGSPRGGAGSPRGGAGSPQSRAGGAGAASPRLTGAAASPRGGAVPPSVPAGPAGDAKKVAPAAGTAKRKAPAKQPAGEGAVSPAGAAGAGAASSPRVTSRAGGRTTSGAGSPAVDKQRPRSVGRTPPAAASGVGGGGSAITARSGSAGGEGRAKFGRRAHSATYAENKISKSLLGKGDVAEQNAENVPVLEGDAGEQREHELRVKKDREFLAGKVAEAPAGYQAEMPRHTELASHSQWERLLQTIHREFDMTCLTACLSPELDDDIPWNPDMLLVQLTSSLRDAAESRDQQDNGLLKFGLAEGPQHDIQLGTMTGGEVIRKRKERDANPDLYGEDSMPPPPSAMMGHHNATATTSHGGGDGGSPAGAAASPSRRGKAAAPAGGSSSTSRKAAVASPAPASKPTPAPASKPTPAPASKPTPAPTKEAPAVALAKKRPAGLVATEVKG